MLRPLVRSLVSTVVAVCFALVSTAGTTMPGCPGQGGVAPPGQHASHGPSDHDSSSGNQACVVHLCCAQMELPAASARGVERQVEQQAAGGFIRAVTTIAARPPHTLPFAHAPPTPIV